MASFPFVVNINMAAVPICNGKQMEQPFENSTEVPSFAT
jgi:hypothetical protein